MIPSVKVTDLTLDQIKNYLRVDYDDDDSLINLILTSANSYIQSYLNIRFDDFDEIPDEFTIACLALCSHWYEKRQVVEDRNAQEIVHMFTNILDIHRNWLGGTS